MQAAQSSGVDRGISPDHRDPAAWSLVEAAAALRDGRIDAQDYARCLIERCDAGAELNAYAAFDAPILLASARAADIARMRGVPCGPLHGVPIALKDNIATQQWPTSAGTAALRGWHPRFDAEIVGRLRNAGALVAGKTSMHELAMGWTGQNATFGDTRNPHDPRRMAGGSSGGSACAVAARMVPAAIGTDTNGSIRVPSAFCGIVGLRPSQGRYPMAGVIPLAPSLDTLGPMARQVADVALLDAVMAGAAPRPLDRAGIATVRLGVCADVFWSRLDDEVERASHRALERLAQAGIECVPIELPLLPELMDRVAADIIDHEATPALHDYLRARDGAPGALQVLARTGEDLRRAQHDTAPARDEAAYRRALERRERLRTLWAGCFAEHGIDALLHPAVRVTAPLRTEPRVSPGPPVPTRWGCMSAREAFAQNVTPATLAGAPSLLLPVRGDHGCGLPVGLQLDGLPGRDRRLVSVGATLEALLAEAGA